MNGKITLDKEKYRELVEKAGRFEIIQKLVFDSQNQFSFEEPATKNISVILKNMKKTAKYSKTFLKSLAYGLKKSTYFSK